MKRTAMVAMTVAALVVAPSAGAAFAAMVEGTNGDNTLTGTPKADTIRVYGGEDVVRGLSGRDKILAGKGRDRLYGGSGDDHIVSRDLDPGGIVQRDVVDCGSGYDTFAADFDDRVLDNCEEGSMSGF